MLKLLSTTLLAGLALAGCATQDYVDEQLAAELAPVNMRLFNVEQRATVQEGGFDALVRRADGVDQVLRSHGDRIQEALDRALAAGKLAEGKLVYEVVLTDDQLRFGDGRANLSDAAKAILDDFAKRLRDVPAGILAWWQCAVGTLALWAWPMAKSRP